MVRVLLDTCVLYQSTLRDTLLRLALAELYIACWSDRILEELRRSLIYKRKISESQAQYLIERLEISFPDAKAHGYQTLIDQMTNSSSDRHVPAAAVVSQSKILVTHNVRDFPKSSWEKYDLEVLTPDQFLCGLMGKVPLRLLHKPSTIRQSHCVRHHAQRNSYVTVCPSTYQMRCNYFLLFIPNLSGFENQPWIHDGKMHLL
jgi:predicted nucleic acid-binding protein